MPNINIIGCGGIGSFLAGALHRYHGHKQIPDAYKVKVFDPDEVEQKNLAYQSFEIDDLYQFKAQVIGVRYGFAFAPNKVEDFSFVGKDDLTVSCVDNAATRAAMFNTLIPKGYKWIDLRSHGRLIAAYRNSPKNTLEVMLATLPDPKAPKVEGSDSCQRSADIAAGRVQNGNQIIAAIGLQLILNALREESGISSFLHEF